MLDIDTFVRIAAALEREQVDYVVVGSMAMAAQGLVRATQDLDIFVAPDAGNIARLRAAPHATFGDPHIDEISAEELAGDYPAVQYVPPAGDYSIDILTRLGEVFRYEDIESEVVDVSGVHVRVATPRMLVRMKRDTVRPKDRLDAEAIRRRFNIEDE